jgi:hypothetical protein
MTRRVDWIWAGLAVAATLVGVWLGAAAADVSPIFTEVPVGAVGPGR